MSVARTSSSCTRSREDLGSGKALKEDQLSRHGLGCVAFELLPEDDHMPVEVDHQDG